jgi:dienelactone hydrolase
MPQTVVLFHSALGLRPAVHKFAELLRSQGHTVHTPDLFDGEVFSNLDDGIRKRDSLGIPVLIQRASASVEQLPTDVAYAGFSLGAASAQFLAGSRVGARGAILMHAALSLGMIGVDKWPAVPVQIHYAARDPWMDSAVVESFAKAARVSGQSCDVFEYKGNAHLFDDDGSADYDPHASASMRQRVLEFLAKL